ncbi:hypothetical protein D9M69_697570 [compost metagenome]
MRSRAAHEITGAVVWRSSWSRRCQHDSESPRRSPASAAKPLSVDGKLSESPPTDSSDHTELGRLAGGAASEVHSPFGSCQDGGDTS